MLFNLPILSAHLPKGEKIRKRVLQGVRMSKFFRKGNIFVNRER